MRAGDSRDETRDVRTQLETWMRRLQQMARDDAYDCEAAQRDITALKSKVDYVERLIVHQGRPASRGGQYRRSTTPRPPTVPDNTAGGDGAKGEGSVQRPPAPVTLQRPYSENENEVAAAAERRRQWQQQSWEYSQRSRGNSQVDKWLPATQERYTTQMAANKYRERHMNQRSHESQRKADEVVRGLVEANKKPWKPRRDRRPSSGLTGLLDHRVVDRAEKDRTRRIEPVWVQEHSARRTIVVDTPGIAQPDWLIRQGQRQGSSRRKDLKEINVYHRTNGFRRTHSQGDPGLLGEEDSEVNVIDFETPPSREDPNSGRTFDSSGKNDTSNS